MPTDPAAIYAPPAYAPSDPPALPRTAAAPQDVGSVRPAVPTLPDKFVFHKPIYVRVTGNDANDGLSVATPKLTAQAAYDAANAAIGLQVLDFGANTEAMPDFGPIALTADWPVRIAVRGAGENVSVIRYIDGAGSDYNEGDLATDGHLIEIVSNRTVCVGDITVSGGSDQVGYGPAGNAGSIRLTDVRAYSVSALGGYGNWGHGGHVTLVDSMATDIEVTGGNGEVLSYGGIGGTVSLLRSNGGYVNANGGPSMALGSNGGSIVAVSSVLSSSGAGGGGSVGPYPAGAGGLIELTQTTAHQLSAYGGEAQSGDGGAGGVIRLIDSSVTSSIVVDGGGSNAYDEQCGDGGTIELTRSNAVSIYANGGYAEGPGGDGGIIRLIASNADTVNADGGMSNAAGGNGGVIEMDGSSAYSVSASGVFSEGPTGPGGAITLIDSGVSTDVLALGGFSYALAGDGGIINLDRATVPGIVDASAADNEYGNTVGNGGTVTAVRSTVARFAAKGGTTGTSEGWQGGDGGTITLTNVSQANALETITVAGGGGAIAGQDGTVNLIYSPPDILGAGLL